MQNAGWGLFSEWTRKSVERLHGNKNRRRPRKRWVNEVCEDLAKLGIGNWSIKAKDRNDWRGYLHQVIGLQLFAIKKQGWCGKLIRWRSWYRETQQRKSHAAKVRWYCCGRDLRKKSNNGKAKKESYIIELENGWISDKDHLNPLENKKKRC